MDGDFIAQSYALGRIKFIIYIVSVDTYSMNRLIKSEPFYKWDWKKLMYDSMYVYTYVYILLWIWVYHNHICTIN